MLRRSLFFGLTLILALAFVFLSVRGCKQEKETVDQPRETVEKSEVTATRVLKPQDLEIARSKTVLERNAGTAARHEVELVNRGNVPYKEVRLNFVYLSSAGKVVETRGHSVVQAVLPGAVLKLADIRIGGLPVSAVNARISIVYADIGNSPPDGKQEN